MPPSPLTASQLCSWVQVITPLGRLRSGGMLVGTRGTGFVRMRVLDGIGVLVLLVAGSGRYRDADGADVRLAPGHVICIPPGRPHMYGPEADGTWSEVFLTFSGSQFDAWFATTRERTLRPGSVAAWLPRWRKILDQQATSPAEAVRVLAEIHLLLNDLLQPRAPATSLTARLEQTRHLLESWPVRSVPDWPHLAEMCELSYERWRKAFRQAYGEPPARYRRGVLMRQAADLLRRSSLTNAQLAEQFGCADAFHFSRMFKAVHGVGPAAWRRI